MCKPSPAGMSWVRTRYLSNLGNWVALLSAADAAHVLGVLLLGGFGEGRVGHRRGLRQPDPFPLAPLRTGREPFSSSGSPVSASLHGWTAGRDPRGCCDDTRRTQPASCVAVPPFVSSMPVVPPAPVVSGRPRLAHDAQPYPPMRRTAHRYPPAGGRAVHSGRSR
jgi:hypothetical protein